MERFVIRQNVEHYRAVLKIATEPAECRRIEKLLLDEEAKLKKYDDHKKKRLALSTSPFGPSLPNGLPPFTSEIEGATDMPRACIQVSL